MGGQILYACPFLQFGRWCGDCLRHHSRSFESHLGVRKSVQWSCERCIVIAAFVASSAGANLIVLRKIVMAEVLGGVRAVKARRVAGRVDGVASE